MKPIRYPAKILLLGEYTILKGSQALAMPFNGFTAQWQTQRVMPPSDTLLKFAEYLNTIDDQVEGFNLDTEKFIRELQQGMILSSNIPEGYGLGSSGAVCAAVFDRIGNAENVYGIGELKQLFSIMESFFHGSSSGLDPLVCYLNQSLLIRPESAGQIKQVNLPKDLSSGQFTLFLLDTGKPRNTRQLVEEFFKDCEKPGYLDRIEAELMAHNEDAIEAFLHENKTLFFDLFHEISFFQYRYMPSMIPAAIRRLWLEGLGSDLYKIKLCGAGGGGFMLGITSDWQLMQQQLTAFKMIRVLTF